jgi:hypothetical protein
LPDDRVTEPVIIEIEDILHDLAIAENGRVRMKSTGETHVVAIRILDEGQRIVGDLVDQLDALMVRRMVDTSLQDAASVAMSGNFHAIGRHGVVYELQRRA